jgi:hypothetical protein
MESLRRIMQAFHSAVHELRTNNIDPWSLKAHPPPQNGKMERFRRILEDVGQREDSSVDAAILAQIIREDVNN